ncbi:MAG: YfiR family protein [Candidatus Magnetomorum sp.]|nr:YfiR family protein [Candidatus Magnetomorum sp.]
MCGIIGDSPIHSVLEKLYQKQKIKGCPIKVRHVHKIDDIGLSHVLFISKTTPSELDAILEQTRDKPIMTVSDTDGFGKKGVLINFYITGKGTLHFEFNSTIMKASALKINLLLLEIAKVIQ